MSTTTIRVTRETRDILNEMAQRAGTTMQSIIDQALDLYRRQQMLSAINNAYAALSNDDEAWSDLEAERSEWDGTLSDGLEEI
ncbi:MAG: toxin-antitoxin system protein [Chloroflexota bacterium]